MTNKPTMTNGPTMTKFTFAHQSHHATYQVAQLDIIHPASYLASCQPSFPKINKIDAEQIPSWFNFEPESHQPHALATSNTNTQPVLLAGSAQAAADSDLCSGVNSCPNGTSNLLEYSGSNNGSCSSAPLFSAYDADGSSLISSMLASDIPTLEPKIAKVHNLLSFAHKYAGQGYAVVTHSFAHSFAHAANSAQAWAQALPNSIALPLSHSLGSLEHSWERLEHSLVNFEHAFLHNLAHPFKQLEQQKQQAQPKLGLFPPCEFAGQIDRLQAEHTDSAEQARQAKVDKKPPLAQGAVHVHHHHHHHHNLKPDLCLFGLGIGLVFNSGCSGVVYQDELLSLEPLSNYKERLNKLPDCKTAPEQHHCVVRSIDSSGAPLVMPYIDGRLEGIAVSFFNNGQIKAAYSYKQGQRNGTFVTFHEDGTEDTSGYYKNNQLQGTLKNCYQSGITRSITSYEQDVKNGPFTTFNQDGSLFSASSYINSHLQNPIITYLENGETRTTYYYQGRLIKADIAKPNGERELFFYLNNQFNGFAQQFYANGQLKRSIKIEDGHKEGFGTRYYANGQVQGLYHYNKGKLHGRILRYTIDGNLQLILSYYFDRLESGTCGNGEPLTQDQIKLLQHDPFGLYPNLCTSLEQQFSPQHASPQQ